MGVFKKKKTKQRRKKLNWCGFYKYLEKIKAVTSFPLGGNCRNDSLKFQVICGALQWEGVIKSLKP
jgi:hypothetical protein